MEILIREIEERDYSGALSLWNNELGNHQFTADNFASHHDRFKGNENYKAFVAELEGHVVGIVHIMQYAPRGVAGEQFWIQGIAVKNDMHQPNKNPGTM